MSARLGILSVTVIFLDPSRVRGAREGTCVKQSLSRNANCVPATGDFSRQEFKEFLRFYANGEGGCGNLHLHKSPLCYNFPLVLSNPPTHPGHGLVIHSKVRSFQNLQFFLADIIFGRT
jgi:hypothetical protein